MPQNPEQAGGARDALARDIYSKMFEWLVTKVNTALNKYRISLFLMIYYHNCLFFVYIFFKKKLELQSSTLIAILDIYGFEIFEDNSFEQFCISM